VAAGTPVADRRPAPTANLPKNAPKSAWLAAKKTQEAYRIAAGPSKVWNYDPYGR
jgi:hypothetical protein